MTNRPPSRLWFWGALVAAIAAALLCLAALIAQHHALQFRPLWRGDQFADEMRLSLLLRSAAVTAIVALAVVWLARARGRADVRNWKYLLVMALAFLTLIPVRSVSSAHSQRLVTRSWCLSNVKNVAIALSMYEDDYSAFPPADYWQDALHDYVMQDFLYQCSQVPGEKSAQALNSRLAGRGLAGIGNPAELVSVFESDRGWNASGGPELLPAYPRHPAQPWRSVGDNYGFADGHAKWFVRPRQYVAGESEPQWLKVAPIEFVTWEPKPTGKGGKRE
jgi:hypothetical protein